MAILQIICAPNEIFKKKARLVEKLDKNIQSLIDDMFETLEYERAVGLGANMVGILERIVVVNIKENGIDNPICLVNPEIIWSSKETQIFEEASLSFPGIAAPITRPKAIKVEYLDYNGVKQQVEAEGFLATVIQHEVDYLNGIVYLDYLSKMKRDLLMKKMQKFIKEHPPHIHGAHCSHN